MSQALYRQYRPKKLSEVVGQEHITTALRRALEKGATAHAYLFTGPRGTGKTSIARILAHELNGLPYTDDAPHLDIIEIDAASNRRIDEIRDLRDKVHLAPTSAKYKVYIIDEVHMLTREAFNALLKTLEEPPAHAVFILATTEAHKLPETIVSRTQRYAFKPVVPAKVAAYLRTLADAEHIAIDDDALALVAAHGEGSFRDSLSLLDRVRNTGERVTLSDVQTAIGLAPDDILNNLAVAVAGHDLPAIAQITATLRDHGIEPAQLARQLGGHYRGQLLEKKNTLPASTLLALLARLVEVPASHDPLASLEIALLDAALDHSAAAPPLAPAEAAPSKPKTAAASAPQPQTVSTQPVRKTTPRPPSQPDTLPESKTPAKPTAKTAETRTTAESQPDQTPRAASTTAVKAAATAAAPLDAAAWTQLLTAIKQQYNTLHGIVSAATPHFDQQGVLRLELRYAFHQKRVREPKNMQILTDALAKICGPQVRIECEVGPGPATAKAQPPEPTATTAPPEPTAPTPAAASESADTNPIATISNIFGGAELLES